MNQTTTCSLSTLSETLQITSRRVQQLAKEGVVHKSGRGKYQYLKSVMGYIAYLSRLVPGKSISDTGETAGDIKAEQCKLVSEKAMIAQMERKEMEGTLILASEVRRDAYTAAVNVRQAMMLVPDSLAPLLVEMDDSREIRAVLRNSITQGLIDASEVIAAGATSGDLLDNNLQTGSEE